MTQLNGLGLQLFDMARRPYGPMFPADVQSATPTAFLRTPTSVNMGASLLVVAGAGNPSLTLSGNLNQALGIRVTCTVAGAPGTARVNISINNGTSNLETNVSTAAGSHAIGTTGANLVFPGAGAYAVGQIWAAICSNFSDQIGANNFTNSTVGQRPTVVVAGQGGVASVHFDASNDVLNCVTGLADLIAGGGINTPFTILALVTINALPSGANVQTILTLGNTGSNARAELQYTATSYRVRRIDNTGAQSLLLSNIPVTTGLCLIDWRFDGVNSTVAVLGADVIGGRSDVSGANSLAAALTLNNVSYGAQKANGSTQTFAAIDGQALFFCQGALDDQEMGRVRQYFATEYGFQIYRNSDVLDTVTFFGGATKGTAAEHWMSFSGQPGLMLPTDDSDGNATFFGFRQPLRMDGTTPYWYYQGTGDPATEQAIVDEHIIMMAEAGIKGVVPLYYTRPADCPSNQGQPAQNVIWHWFELYQTSQYRNRLKFAVMCTSRFASFDTNSGPQPQFPLSFGTFLNLPNMAAYWASLMLDPQYMRDQNGFPFFYIYNDPGGPWTAAHLTTIRSAAQALGFPNVRFVNPNEDATLAASLGTQMTSYGPNSSVFAGQNSYQTQINKDRSFWAVSPSIAKQVGITLVNDGRVVRGMSTWWVDRATYSELENALEQTCAYARISRSQVPDHCAQAYSGGEWAEGGDFFFTRQSITLGVNTPPRGIILDAYKNVSTETYPPTFWDWYHADSKSSQIVRVGTWTIVNGIAAGGGSNPAPFDFSEIQTSTAGATLTFSPTFVRDGLRLYGSMGPAYGSFNVQVDGGAPTLVVQTAVSTSRNNLLFDSGALAPGTHTLTVTQVSGLIAADRLGAHRVR